MQCHSSLHVSHCDQKQNSINLCLPSHFSVLQHSCGMMPYTEQTPAPCKCPKRVNAQWKTECQAPHRDCSWGNFNCIWGLTGRRKGGSEKTSTEVLLTLYHRFPQDCSSSDQDAYHVREKNKQFITLTTRLDNAHLTRHFLGKAH